MAADQMSRLLAGGRALAESGDLDAAASHFEQAHEIAPGSPAPLHDLGIVRLRQGRHDDAERCFRRVVELAPESAAGHTGLGAVFESRDRLAQAHACFLRAVELEPGSADARANLASVLQASGRLDAAASAYRAALERQPDHARALTGLAVLLDLAGRHAEGLELLARAAGRADADLELARVRLLEHAGRGAEAIGRVQGLLASPGLPRRAERHARFALAGLLDGAGRYAEAFAEAARANALDPPEFERAACRDYVTRARQCFSRRALACLPRSANRSDRPVFVVGMPRSGTTLVEQILASHPEIHGAGERNELLWLAGELGTRAGGDYLDAVPDLDAEALDNLADRYLAGAEPSAARVIDKMPVNFRHLGLVALMLPCARVIHCRRHPLDTALSCFMHDFSGPELAFASRLDDIALYYGAYRELMHHWLAVLDLRAIEVDYESLVDDLETQARRLVEFLGLDWDARCLRFNELERTVNTASQSQVRRPLYATAVGRHRHYARELAPLAAAWAGADQTIRP
ncbi:MAG TPA: sulfotransferase [Gammaproteobacteria bacterium]|nr:sulfotransferase [Gammaproteobacteria bacterium]